MAALVLATIGYFDYSYKLPRLTVVLVTPLLQVGQLARFVFEFAGLQGAKCGVSDNLRGVNNDVSAEFSESLRDLCPTSVIRQSN